MHTKQTKPIAFLMLWTMVAATLGTQTARADEAMRKLLTDKQAALVTIKFILKIKLSGPLAGMGDQETETEITGVMVRPNGVVLCSNSRLAGMINMIKKMVGSMADNVSGTPTDLKVLVGDDEEGKEAELIARDSELDLAWVRIKEPGGETFTYVDFANGATGGVGQRVLAMRRLNKYFGRVPAVAEGHIGGMTQKPRELYVASGAPSEMPGMPVYDASGKPLGFTIMQVPENEAGDDNPMGMLSSLSNLQDLGALILPAREVAKATARALASAENE
ncbi:MAG: serine protease [Planctomycetota bacterium]|nr:MAG: serine protease [Planctomycetota bacterium]